jgi:actin related protein 2/3 complex subunit 2
MASSSANTKGLIFLETGSNILKEQISPRILEGKREACELVFSDFDNTNYKLSVAVDTPNVMRISVDLPEGKKLKDNGGKAVIDRLFPGYDVAPDSGYCVTLQIDCDRIQIDKNKLITDLSELKRHLLGGPLDRAFKSLLEKKSGDLPMMQVNYRATESMFVCPSASKIVVIFQVDFADQTDKAMAKIILQEFVEAQRTIRTAPPVSYSKDAPMELSNLKLSISNDIAGFISFALEERHIQGNRCDSAVSLLASFRPYLHYHIKCSKTYLHMRMRKRVAGWMQVLNRAIPDIEGEKKTATGKTFTRK